MRKLPRVVFVLGKGGVGRSTVATALGSELARRGERTCVFGWTFADPISPWFGLPPAGLMPRPIAPRLSVANYRLDATLELYFVEHLHLPRFYRHVIDGVHVRKLIEAAPGIAEVFFVGHLWWLTTLAAKEAGIELDRVIVDAPATGHGASLLDMASVLASLRGTGLVGVETERVVEMMTDPRWTGALVVTLPEELSVEETVELVPRVTSRLKRPPLALVVNRSVRRVLGDEPEISLAPFAERVSRGSRAAVDTVIGELQSRVRLERAVEIALEDATERGALAIDEQLLLPGSHEPREVVRGVASAIDAWLEAP